MSSKAEKVLELFYLGLSLVKMSIICSSKGFDLPHSYRIQGSLLWLSYTNAEDMFRSLVKMI